MGSADEPPTWPRPFTAPTEPELEEQLRQLRQERRSRQSVPVTPGLEPPQAEVRHLGGGMMVVSERSKLGRVALSVSIIRDLVIIVLLISAAVAAGILTNALVHNGARVRGPEPGIELPCPTPKTDSSGRYCPEAPGD